MCTIYHKHKIVSIPEIPSLTLPIFRNERTLHLQVTAFTIQQNNAAGPANLIG